MKEASSEVARPLDGERDRCGAAGGVESDGHWCWQGRLGAARFSFYGKASGAESRGEREVEAALERAGLALATLRQVHSARVIEAAAPVRAATATRW